MAATSIEWADHSINPIRAKFGQAHGPAVNGHYCEKISPGCANCYASTLQKRFKLPSFPGETWGDVTVRLDGTTKTGVVPYLDETKIAEVLRRKKPTRYFWCDMTDAFGWWVPDAWLDKMFATMAISPQHTHLVLTKRPERMREYITRTGRSIEPLQAAARSLGYSLQFDFNGRKFGLTPWPLPNVWLGVSAEDQRRFDERAPLLAKTPAAVRFLSAEPLLGPIDCVLDVAKLDWVIVGGESGHGARPCTIGHVREIVQQCAASGVACFVKQLGSKPVNREGEPHACANRKGGDPAEWPENLRVRQFPDGQRLTVGS